MALVAPLRPELFTQQEVAEIAGLPRNIGRHVVAQVAPKRGILWKRDPSRGGIQRLMDRDDVESFCRFLNTEPDWSAVEAA